jgi:hypothetical protein
MDYYQKYIKYKNKYLQLKGIKKNQIGGSDNVLYNSNTISLPYTIKEDKKEIFINIILWIAQDSKYNKNTKINKSNDKGFNFLFNSENEKLNKELNNDNYQEYIKNNDVIQLKFNPNNNGFIFVDNVRSSKNEIFELIFIMKNINILMIPNNFDVYKLKFIGKNNIYSRIEFLKSSLFNNDNPLESMIDLEYKKQNNIKADDDIKTDNNIKTYDDIKTDDDIKDIRYIKKYKESIIDVPDFIPNIFYPRDYSIGTNLPINNKNLDDSSFITESSISSDFSSDSSELYKYNE